MSQFFKFSMWELPIATGIVGGEPDERQQDTHSAAPASSITNLEYIRPEPNLRRYVLSQSKVGPDFLN